MYIGKHSIIWYVKVNLLANKNLSRCKNSLAICIVIVVWLCTCNSHVSRYCIEHGYQVLLVSYIVHAWSVFGTVGAHTLSCKSVIY